jgi:hypothetical protein
MQACGNEKKHDYQKIGNALCSCSQKLSKFNSEFEKLVQNKKSEKIMKLLDSLALEESALKLCIINENKETQFLTDKNSSQKLLKVVSKNCPDRSEKILELTQELK